MITRKNDAFVAKIENTRLTKIFIAIFAPDERLPSSATLEKRIICFQLPCLELLTFKWHNADDVQIHDFRDRSVDTRIQRQTHKYTKGKGFDD